MNTEFLIPTCLLALWAALPASAQGPLADPIPLPIPTSEIKEELIPNVGMFIKGFGQDARHQLYVLGSTSIGPSGTGGQILRIDRADKD